GAVRIEQLAAADAFDLAPRPVSDARRPLPRRRVSDPDRGRDGLRVGDGHPTDERGGAFGLVSIHPRSLPGEARLGRLDKALPVRGDVPSIADGDEEGIGRVSDRLAELERGRFLSLDAVRID